jgi:hypothetical protein
VLVALDHGELLMGAWMQRPVQLLPLAKRRVLPAALRPDSDLRQVD